MDSKPYARTIKGRPAKVQSPTNTDAIHNRALASAEKSRTLVTLSEQVAQDKFCYKSWLVDEARAFWPSAPQMWHVEKMYPNASGGKLLVDEPQTDYELRECEKKAAKLKDWGYRYLIVKSEMTVAEALHEIGD